MARMIPSQFSTSKARGLDEKSGDRAELLVFAALQELPNSYTCLHSYRMARREIDFLIIHPETPLVFLEVKGGLLVQKDGRSYQENRATKQLYEISPIEQLYAAREDLIFGLRAGALEEAAKAFPFVFFAVFPDSLEPTSLLPQFDGASLFGDQLNLPEKLNEIFMTKARKFGALGHANAQALIEFFSREIRAQPHVLLEKLFDQEEQIAKGTQESVQAHIETILANPQFLVEGSAGTGKTILLTELARTLAQKGERVLITCYNDLIEHLLQSTFKESPKVQVSNFHHLCEDSIEKAFGRQLLQQQKQLLQTPEDTKTTFQNGSLIDSLKLLTHSK
ncbi:MAG: NERD domain-containing protein/DEAD/DEAH box helicase [Bdellovibrionales bacterium]|nr:NERD domain-containing protein/DEAD/DEAH box helicase [Bdellovibrionales bacterium]